MPRKESLDKGFTPRQSPALQARKDEKNDRNFTIGASRRRNCDGAIGDAMICL